MNLIAQYITLGFRLIVRRRRYLRLLFQHPNEDMRPMIVACRLWEETLRTRITMTTLALRLSSLDIFPLRLVSLQLIFW
jgi:hypothetical protein